MVLKGMLISADCRSFINFCKTVTVILAFASPFVLPPRAWSAAEKGAVTNKVSGETDPNAVLSESRKLDPFMGDWSGNWKLSDGSKSGEVVAQVIALGRGKYRVNLLEAFDQRIPAIAVFESELQGAKLTFGGNSEYKGTKLKIKAAIEADNFTGDFEGKDSEGQDISGTFELKKTVRLSPTLGAKPPAGAIMLFDGKNFDQWEQTGGFAGLISIAEIIGAADNVAAYLRSQIWSAKQEDATLEIGSDDGIKVWLNDQLVHANNAGRPVTPGEDKVKVALKQGWNKLLLKVTNIGGNWGACARLVGTDGKRLSNINEMVSKNSSDTGTDKYLQANDGYLTVWEISGPYRQEGKGGGEIFDVAFPPEKLDSNDVRWQTVAGKTDKKVVQWKLLPGGAMEVAPGSGSIVTKKKFTDFNLHLEFRTPFMPEARGQSRGNSGVYLQGRYEIQILDSYGLEGRDNECGGIYTVAAPLVNMCAPPMQWQTYDVNFHAPRFDNASNKTKDALVTVMHNGVNIICQKKIRGPTAVALDSNVTQPGGVYLQDHGNPVQFRNIWLVESPVERASP